MGSLVKEMNYRVKGTEMFWNDPEGAEAIIKSAPPASATTLASPNIRPPTPDALSLDAPNIPSSTSKSVKADMHASAQNANG